MAHVFGTKDPGLSVEWRFSDSNQAEENKLNKPLYNNISSSHKKEKTNKPGRKYDIRSIIILQSV